MQLSTYLQNKVRLTGATLYINIQLSFQVIEQQKVNKMIKAPFRFEIEYFSVLVVLQQSTQKQSKNFLSEDQNGIFQPKMSKKDLFLLKSIQNPQYHNSLKRKVNKQKLYFLVQNKKNLQFYGSVNTTQEMEMQTKTIFSDVTHLYFYIRKNCNSQQIKMTKKGNLIVEYFIDETIYQVKIENQHFLTPLKDIQEIWKELKNSWDKRKHMNVDECQKCLNFVQTGKVQVHSKIYKKLVNKHYKQQGLESKYQMQSEKNKENRRQQKDIQNPEYKKRKIEQKRKRRRQNKNHKYYKCLQLSQQQEIGSERLRKPRKNLNYIQQDQSYIIERQTNQQLKRQEKQTFRKQREYLREYDEDIQNNQTLIQRKRKQRQTKTNNQQDEFRFDESLQRIQSNLENMQKQTAEYVIDRITKNISQKMDQLIQKLTQHFNKHKNNIKQLNSQVQENEGYERQ